MTRVSFPRAKIIASVAGVAIWVTLVTSGMAQCFPGTLSRKECELLVLQMLQHQAVPRLEIGPGIRVERETPSTIEFVLPREIPAGEEVVAEYKEGRAEVDRVFGYVRSLWLSSVVYFWPEHSVGIEEAKATAFDFVRKFYPFMHDGRGTVESFTYPLIQQSWQYDVAHYSFEWRKKIADTRTGTFVSVDVRVSDGAVIHCVANYTDHLVREKSPIDAEAAIRIGRRFVREMCKHEHRTTTMTEEYEGKVIELDHQDSWRLRHSVMFKLSNGAQDSSYVNVLLHIDCETGEVTLSNVIPVNPEVTAPSEPKIEVHDRLPVCAGDRIAFVSRRRRQGFPSWLKPDEHLFLLNLPSKELRYVLFGRDEGIAGVSLSRDGTVCGIQQGCMMVNTCSLLDGQVRTHTTSERTGASPCVSPDGKYVAMSADRPFGDEDIFVADVENSLKSSRGQWRVALLRGKDIGPVFSPDGKWLAFAHRDPWLDNAEYEKGWSVYRAAPYAPYWENKPAEKLANIPGMIQRLTWFPDGRRILVYHSKGVHVVKVKENQIEELLLPPLHDPDLPSGRPLLLKDVTLDATGLWLVFSGFRWSGDLKDPGGWYIYRCRLDGSEIQRLTPIEDKPVAPYVFPRTGQSALDFAKEKVRRELQESTMKKAQ